MRIWPSPRAYDSIEALAPGGDLRLDAHPRLELALEGPRRIKALEDVAVGPDEQVDGAELPTLAALLDAESGVCRAGTLRLGPLNRGRSAAIEGDPERQAAIAPLLAERGAGPPILDRADAPVALDDDDGQSLIGELLMQRHEPGHLIFALRSPEMQ